MPPLDSLAPEPLNNIVGNSNSLNTLNCWRITLVRAAAVVPAHLVPL